MIQAIKPITRDQAIAVAWAELEIDVTEVKLEENGGIKFWLFEKSQHDFVTKHRDKITITDQFARDGYVYRPISIEGIDNNRGWIVLSKPEDLPMGESCFLECYGRHPDYYPQFFHHFNGTEMDAKYIFQKASCFKRVPFSHPVFTEL
jgi:hypothetical protein